LIIYVIILFIDIYYIDLYFKFICFSLYGLTGVAFGRSLSSFIAFVRTSIVEMAETITGQGQMKIVRLYHIIDDASLVIERIAAFCRCVCI